MLIASILLLVAAAASAQGSAGHSPSARTSAAKRPPKRSHVLSTHSRACGSSSVRGHLRGARAVNCHTAKSRSLSRKAQHSTAPSRKRITIAGEAAETQAVTIAKVLATPCQNTQLTPEPGNLPLVRAAVLCLVNTKRAQNGKDPLKTDARLEQAAESHGKEMIAVNYFDHIAPSGLTPVERIRRTGYLPSSEVGYVIGENLAWGTLSLSTPQAIVNAWIASPEHLANMLEGKYRDTGIDIEPEVPASIVEGVAGATYTQEFGVVVH